MTADELQAIVIRLSNSCWVRYWLHWNYPQNPVQMALHAVEFKGDGTYNMQCVPMIKELKKYVIMNKFPLRSPDILYIIPRTNEDGTIYESKLV